MLLNKILFEFKKKSKLFNSKKTFQTIKHIPYLKNFKAFHYLLDFLKVITDKNDN